MPKVLYSNIYNWFDFKDCMIKQEDFGEDKFMKIIGRFNNKKIGVVGDVLLDSYLFGRVTRVNPDRPGYPLLTVERQEHRLGGAGNPAQRAPAQV